MERPEARARQAITESGNTIAEKWDASGRDALPGAAWHTAVTLSLVPRRKPSGAPWRPTMSERLSWPTTSMRAARTGRNAQIAKGEPNMPDGGAGRT